MTYKEKQSNSLWITVTHANALEIDSTWAHWSGKWAIAPYGGGTNLLTGDLVLSTTPGDFLVRIGPVTTSGWSVLPVGTYDFYIELNNLSCDYKKEYEHKLVIEAQGII